MIERIRKTGSKVLLLLAVFFLGVVAQPAGWNFWDFLEEISHNPVVMKFVLYIIVGFFVIAAIVYVIGQIKKEN